VDSPNQRTDEARRYHAITEHSYTSVRTHAHQLDWQNKPFPFKIYPQLPGLPLPRDLHLPDLPVLQALTAPLRPTPGPNLTLERLTRLLYCAGGLTHHRHLGMETYHFRAAASAGALYPIELYVATGPSLGNELEPGLYHFSPADLKLRGLRRGDWRDYLARACAMNPALARAEAVMVLTAMFWRSTWKYQARAYRYCYWDAGTIAANLIATAAAEACPTQLLLNFVDADIERLLGVDGEHEGVLALAAIGEHDAAAPAAPNHTTLAPLEAETVPLSLHEETYPDLVRMHQASKLLAAEEVAAIAQAAVAAPLTPAASRTELAGRALGETILARGSTRVFAHDELAHGELGAILAASSIAARADVPSVSTTYVIVNAAAGVKPGAYYYDCENARLELLKPGDFRDQARYLCLEQDLGGDASALIVYMADFDAMLRSMGNRGYRAAQFEAGLRGGRAYLAAYGLGRGATGLTFYDQDTTGFFAPHAAGKIPLLMVATGVAA
jgi:SagB-type dehydrogenase family enzyme